MSVFYDLSKTPRNILSQAIVRAIVSENNGALFDPSDMTTMFQDAAGTIPVTAVEQPVGLILDKSRGLILGPELVSNGAWLSGSAALISNKSDFGYTHTAVIGDGFTYVQKQLLGLDTNKFYKISVDYIVPAGVISTFFRFRANDLTTGVGAVVDAALLSNTNGTKTFIAKPSGTTMYIGSSSGSDTVNITLSNISVRELYGNHATQSITASRPTLSARYNLLTKTEDFSDVAWTKANLTNPTYPPVVTPDATIGPDGITYADLVTPANIAGSAFIEVYQNSTIISGTKYHQYYCVKPNGWRYLQSAGNGAVFSSGHVNFDLVTGTVTANTPGTGGVSGDITPLANGWFLLHVSATAIANGTSHLSINFIDSATASRGQPATGNGVDGVYVTRGDFRAAAEQNSYQRVNTATDYDTDERYFKKYLRFDGVDDYLNLPYMGLYAAGSASMVMARDTIIPSSQQNYLTEASSTSTPPLYYLDFQLSGQLNLGFFIRNDAGTQVALLSNNNGESVSTVSVKTMVDNGNNVKKYRNGTLLNSDNYVRSGTLALSNTLIGAIGYGTPVNFAKMNLYGLIITKSALTDAQRVRCERYAASKAGVIL